MIRHLISGSAILVAAFLFVLPGARAQPMDVTVRAVEHSGFGRLAFDWPAETGYKVRLEGSELVVSFAGPGRFDLAAVERDLEDYIGKPRADEDGRTLRVRLKGAFGLRHYSVGSTVVVDLLGEPAGPDGPVPQGASAAKVPAAPADPPQPSREAGPRVPVRVGEHPGFSRVVFDWPQEVAYRVEESPGRITVRFARPGRIDTAQFRRDPPPQVTALVPRATSGGVAAELAVPNGAGLRHFVDNGHVVIDVLAPGGSAQAQAEPRDVAVPLPAAKPKAPDAQAAEEATSGVVAAGASESAEAEAEGATAGGAAVAADAEAAPEAAQGPPTRLLPGEHADQDDVQAAGKPDGEADSSAEHTAEDSGGWPGARRFAIVDQTSAPPPGTASVKAGDGEQSVPQPAAQSETAVSYLLDGPQPAPATASVTAEPKGLVAANPATEVVAEAPGPGRTPSLNQPIALRFNWTEPVAAAAFRRAGRLWLVFDRPVQTNIAKKIVEAAPVLAPADQLAHGGATIIRLSAPPTYSAVLKPDRNDWVVDLRQRDDVGTQPLDIELDQSTGETRLRVPLERPGALVQLVDPDLGGELRVVPVHAPRWGVDRPHSLPEVRILESYQGLVLEPLADGLRVEVVEDAALVSAEGGLQASDPRVRQTRASPGPAVADGRRLFDLEAWRGRGRYLKTKQDLQRAVVEAPEGAVDLARLDLARFYFAHGLATEALGVLQLMESQRQGEIIDPQLLLMKGASELLAHQHESAARDLSHIALNGEWEAQPWRGALAAVGEDWATAARLLTAGDPLIEAYAPPVRNRLWLLAAEARLAIGDGGAASQYLDLVTNDGPNAFEEAQAGYLEGRRLAWDGDLANAKLVWRQVAQSAHPASAARARLALIDLGLEQGTMSPAQAIGELERLRFAWRGDEFEFAILEQLAELYLSTGRARDALVTMRHAASNLPSSPRAKAVAQRMREAFADLFLGDSGKELPPVKALALYREFRELTPSGDRGDAVIAVLADRLVEVDLLPQASELLETQLKFRLEGLEKVRTGTRVALLYLLDERPGDALAVLAGSELDGIPEKLARERRLLKARALADMERSDDALALLGDDKHPDTLRLRADILWSARKWGAAAAALQALLPESLPEGAALTEEQARIITTLAVAYTLANDRGRLRDLDWNYARSMAATPQAATFAMLTGDLETGAIASVADELAGVEAIQDFMASYRERIREKGLSAVN